MIRNVCNTILMTLAVTGAVSCVQIDNGLDLDRNLNLDVHLGENGLYLPLGSVDTVWMDSLLSFNSKNAELRHLDDGTLAIGLDGKIDSTGYGLKPVDVKIQDILIPSFIHEFGSLGVTGFVKNAVCNVLDSAMMDIDAEVDNAIVSMSAALFAQPAVLDMRINLGNLPSSADTIILNDFEVRFPDYLNISYNNCDTRINYDSQAHRMVFSGRLTDGEITSGVLNISGLSANGLKFSSNPIEKQQSGTRLTVSGQKVRISGTVDIRGRNLALEDLKNLELSFSSSIPGFSIDSITGVVNPEPVAANYSVAMSFGDDLDFLFDKENSLKLSGMQLALNLRHALPVDMDLSIGVSSKDRDGAVLSGGVIVPDNGSVTVPKCACAGDTCNVTLLFYAGKAPSVNGTDTIPVMMSGLTDILSVMPDSILFSLETCVSSQNEQTFRLADITVDGTYNIDIPLAFDEMTVVYSDTIDDINAGFRDAVGELETRLEARYVSNVQFGAVLNVWAVDSLGNVVPEVQADPVNVPPCQGPEPVDQPISFNLKIMPGGAKAMDRLVFSIRCRAEHAFVRTGGYILVRDAYLVFENGLDLDLKEF